MEYCHTSIDTKLIQIQESLGSGSFTAYNNVYYLNIPEHITKSFKDPILGVSTEEFKENSLNAVGIKTISVNKKDHLKRSRDSFYSDYNLSSTDVLTKDQQEELIDCYSYDPMDIDSDIVRLEAENLFFFWTERMEEPNALENESIGLALEIFSEKNHDILDENYFFQNWIEMSLNKDEVEKILIEKECELTSDKVGLVNEVLKVIDRDISLMGDNMDTDTLDCSNIDLHDQQFMKDEDGGLKIVDMLYMV